MTADTPIAPRESTSEAITRGLGLFLSRWGVDAVQYHWLLQASLKMDFRSSGGPWSKPGGETKSALRMTALFNLAISAFMSLFLSHALSAFFFSAIMIGYAMALLAMMILIEFGLAVVSPDDHLILAYRPITSRTFLAVRFSNMAFYVLVLGLSLLLAPAFAGCFCKDAPWFFPAVFLPVSMAACLFVAGLVVALYGFLMRWFNYEKFKDVLLYCQMALSFVFFFGYQILPRMAANLRNVDISRLTHHWGLAFPCIWFAGLIELGLGHWSRAALLNGGIATLATCLLIPGMLRAISLDYSEHIGRMTTASKKSAAAQPSARSKIKLSAWLARRFIGDIEERAFFCFITAMLARNRQLKLQLTPMFGYMVAMFALPLMDSHLNSDPLTRHGDPMAGYFAGLGFVMLGSSLIRLLPYSDEYAGAWVFQMAPVSNPAAILKAIKKAALLYLYLPMFVFAVILFSFLWPIVHAFEFGIYGLLSGLVAFQILLFYFDGFPFSRKPEKGTQSSQFAGMMLMLGLIGVMIVLPLLLSWSQFAAQAALWVICAAMAVGSVILSGRNNRRFAARGLAMD
jgi:hypothetical protein